MNPFFTGFKKGFTKFGTGITLIVNALLLTIVYFTGVGITSMIARVRGKHFLLTHKDRKAKTYWQELNLKRKQVDTYYRQF